MTYVREGGRRLGASDRRQNLRAPMFGMSALVARRLPSRLDSVADDVPQLRGSNQDSTSWSPTVYVPHSPQITTGELVTEDDSPYTEHSPTRLVPPNPSQTLAS